MDKQLERAVQIQKEYDAASKTMAELGPKRNKLVVQLAKKMRKSEIANALGISSQRVIQIIKKEQDDD